MLSRDFMVGVVALPTLTIAISSLNARERLGARGMVVMNLLAISGATEKNHSER